MRGFDRPGERSWESPECTGFGRLTSRSPLVPFPDAESAAMGDRERSPWHVSLDGDWRFALFDHPDAIPQGVERADFDDAAWTSLEVPGNWTVQGFDRPHYTNVQMPFPERPPKVPEENPTGVYRRRFSLPKGLANRRVVLHFGGAESVLYVWVNGEPIGYAKDSRLASEFDVTRALVPGENLVVAVVVRWSDASFIEDQDHWWMAGLHREVRLYATGHTWLADLRVQADYDPDDGRGRLSVAALLGASEGDADGWSVEAMLYDPKGRPALREPLRGQVRHRGNPYLFTGDRVPLLAELPRVQPWSAESPALYRLVVSLRDPEGRCGEAVSERVGFRRVEVADRELRINGRAVLIKGVNRHDHDEVHGKAVSREAMRADLVLMKQFNFNAVRTAHYPNDPHLLDLCDELGLYVIDEANVESHAHLRSLSDDPRYLPPLLDRVERMVRRDENHACVIAWSLGNESGHGAAHGAMAGFVRRYDPSRPIHYEGALEFGLSPARLTTDLVCPMYAPIDAIVKWARETKDDRPLILCEYSHAMGNSNGTLAEYFEAFERHRGLQGGFIWDWMDQGLKVEEADGTTWWAYGGDFGDEPNDENFNINGLVWPDRTPHPAMWEFKKLAQPIRVIARDLRRGRIRVKSALDFVDTSFLRGRYELKVDGRVVQRGRLPRLVIAPGEHADVSLPIRRPPLSRGEEVHLDVRFETARDLDWAPRGHVVASEQLEVPWQARGPRDRRQKAPAPLEVEQGADVVRVAGDGFGFAFDAETGVLSHAMRGAVSLLAEPLSLCLWRAPTDNDRLLRPDFQRGSAWLRWLDLGLDRIELARCDTAVRRRGDHVAIVSRRELQVGDPAVVVEHRESAQVEPGGFVRLSHTVSIPEELGDLPRLGVSFSARSGLENLSWFGRGPHENYDDRKAGAHLGRWESTVTEQFVPYIRPQENGNKTGTRWFSLRPDAGPGLLVAADRAPVEFGASHYRAEDLHAARHPHELVARPEVCVHVDARQRGLGTGSCGPDTLSRYRIRPGTHRFGLRLRALAPSEEAARLARRDPFAAKGSR